MKGKRHLARSIALLVVAFLSLSLAIGPVASQEPGPEGPEQEYFIYLPLVQKPPSTLYGFVTDDGVAAPGVWLELWFYNGSVWDDIDTTTTNANGYYQFTGMPALLAGQKYLVEYWNDSDSTRLGVWDTRELTSFTAGSVVNIGNFDIANIALASPAPGSEAVPPGNFQWTPRPTTPSDSYKFNILDFYDNNPSFVGPSLGYVNSYTLSSLPALFQYCNPYFWGVIVNSPDGGWGMSYWVYLVTLHQTALSGIHGCVTLGSTPVSGVSLELRKWTGSQYTSAGTATTNANGYYAFTGKSSLNPGQEYYVRYLNQSNSSRLWFHGTDDLTSYTSGSSVFIGDFDIADIELVSPLSGSIVSPTSTFWWSRRAATQWDNYEFDIYDPNDSVPYFYSEPPLGYVDHYTMTGLPAGFAYYTTYWWEIWVYDLFGGDGNSFDSYSVSFSPTGMSAEPAANSGEFNRPDPELLRMRGPSLTNDRLRMRPVDAGLRHLQVEP